MKCLCGSANLKAYNHDNLNYILNYTDNGWTYVNPRLNNFFFTSKHPWQILCLNCSKQWTMINPKKFATADVSKYKEIVLDLDQTLFYAHGSYNGFDIEHFDFIIQDPESKYSYKVIKRPGLKEFIELCLNRFDKINIFTAATDWYAEAMIKELNIPAHQLGFVKTRSDTVSGRPLSFDWEAIKRMDNCLVVEDKPLVVEGSGNTIFKVNHFTGDSSDTELFELQKYLNQTSQIINSPDFFNGEINLFLKDYKISFQNLPTKEYNSILNIPALNQDELNLLPIRTSYYKPFLTYEDNQALFSFTDISYENYSILWDIISQFTLQKKLSINDYNQLIDKKYQQYKNKLKGF